MNTTSAVRQKRLRERRRKDPDARIYRVEANEPDLARALIASDRLSAEATLRQQLVERELSALIRDFVERWRGTERWPP